MGRLFECLKLFVDWIRWGLYDFASLPLALRVHLDPKDVEIIENIPRSYCKFVLKSMHTCTLESKH